MRAGERERLDLRANGLRRGDIDLEILRHSVLDLDLAYLLLRRVLRELEEQDKLGSVLLLLLPLFFCSSTLLDPIKFLPYFGLGRAILSDLALRRNKVAICLYTPALRSHFVRLYFGFVKSFAVIPLLDIIFALAPNDSNNETSDKSGF